METKVIKNYDLGRFELYIEGKLIGYSDGKTPEEHLEGGKILKELAEEKGHTVTWVESDGKE